MNRLLYCFVFITCFLTLFSCRKEYSFEQGNILPSEGSLWDSTGACLPSTVHGTFYNGITPGSDTAYVDIQVNVTQTGSYNIETDLQDGFSFADSGFFSNTGINTVHLKPVGIPIINTTSTFTVTFDSTACSFTVVIQDSTGTGLGGGGDTTNPGNTTSAWQFTTTAGTFSGTFDTAVIAVDTTIWQSGGQMLVLQGKTNTTDSLIAFYVYLPTGVIVPGSYPTESLPPSNASLFAFIDFSVDPVNGTPIYASLPGDTAGNVTVDITSYDNATQIVKGTFAGKTEDKNGNKIDVSNGSFTAIVTP